MAQDRLTLLAGMIIGIALVQLTLMMSHAPISNDTVTPYLYSGAQRAKEGQSTRTGETYPHTGSVSKSATDVLKKVVSSSQDDSGSTETSSLQSSQRSPTSPTTKGHEKFDGNIFIAVVTSRANLSSRVVKAIQQTWVHRNIDAKVTIRYFVGSGDESHTFLSNQAAIEDSSELVIMSQVPDDEYPPVHKNTMMLQYALETVVDLEREKDKVFQYIMKVDDDTFVNLDGLLRFLQSRHSSKLHYWGRRGFGLPEVRSLLTHAGMTRPYCMGGPGYIMSRSVLEMTVAGLADCVKRINESKNKHVLWHSDVVIGMCITQLTGVSCQGDGKHENDSTERRNRSFVHMKSNDELDKFLSNMKENNSYKKVVSMHPFKKSEEMIYVHQQFDQRNKQARTSF